MSVIIRPARTSDVRMIRELIDTYSPGGRLLSKNTVTIYEDVQEFVVADSDGVVVGCGALHVMWEDLGEVRTVAVVPEVKGTGVGGRILASLLERATALGLTRVFCLTFETAFFGHFGFEAIAEAPVDASVYAQLLQSGDEGVAEFLDLERVKPNTLGNTRMLKFLL
jgi:amino-acid N-acetyltransferase